MPLSRSLQAVAALDSMEAAILAYRKAGRIDAPDFGIGQSTLSWSISACLYASEISPHGFVLSLIVCSIWTVNYLTLGEFASDKKLGAAFGNNNPTLYKKNFKLE